MGAIPQAGQYVQITPDRDGSLPSRVTGLILRIEGTSLRLFDARTGERILLNRELNRERGEAATERVLALEDELDRFRAELDRSRRGS